ncbi:toll-like receptor 4 isoform X2 [Ascaphus truei]|uniref:toll-like receptor 4 isoform X2 n=1 Tax=Ascaphus truei TaxID=8439 RepID=UPI003F5904D8
MFSDIASATRTGYHETTKVVTQEIPLVSFSCSAGNFSILPVDLPASIQSLDFSFNPLKYLYRKYFSLVPNLQELDLTRCSIMRIDDMAFQGLDNLHTLVLTGNPVSYWASQSFFGLQSLHRLVVVETSLTSLFDFPVGNLTSLRELNAGSNLLTSLRFPTSLLSLYTLDLHANQIADICESDLETLRSIKTINLTLILSRNRMEHIAPGAFRSITLHGLHIRGCFSTAEALRTGLKALSGLQVEKLEIGHYRNYGFKIHYQDGLLEGLCEVDAQELTINTIVKFPNGTKTLFDCMKNMTSLRLVNTNLNTFSPVSNASRLQYLVLKNCDLSYVPSWDLSNLLFLRELRITGCRDLAKFSMDLIGMYMLELLDLSRNQLRIDSCCSQIISGILVLKHLNLSYNMLIHINSVFLELPELCSLDLSHSRLLNVGKFPIFMRLGKLTVLDLSYTDCHFLIHCSFCGLYSLKQLSVSGNTFDSNILSAVFQNLTQLRSLDLSDCGLEDLPTGIFSGLELLQELKLSGNRLLELQPSVLTPLSALTHLDLSGNQFQSLPEETARALPLSLAKLDLSQNPFDCSCSQHDFVSWTNEQKEKVLTRSEHMVCKTPEHLQDFQLTDVLHLNCHVDLSILAGVLGTLLPAMTAFLLLYLCYSQNYLLLLRHWCCQHLYPKRITEDEYDAFVIYSSGDEEWVRRQLVPNLEEGKTRFRLCLHYRDFLPGVAITSNIINEGLLRSRKALVILSRNFMQSPWCSFEFDMAKSWQFLEGRVGIIVILLEQVTKVELRQVLGLHKYLRRNTYLEWGNGPLERTMFWVRLRKALDKGHSRRTSYPNIENNYGHQDDETQC